ncbi:DNA (cytosine-5)-methyltransferase 3A-like [Actinia tenebrosa]|uniref:DNA (cytosine-5-)-methyltransferase n=1 Tax=Actinia tenebrosa TaxID=6105 RepID=A0A6P8IZG3_ACTTE|nr:DNA (cytosine-5)-methyltransferase 3A-like [Actinia tenebrosa]
MMDGKADLVAPLNQESLTPQLNKISAEVTSPKRPSKAKRRLNFCDSYVKKKRKPKSQTKTLETAKKQKVDVPVQKNDGFAIPDECSIKVEAPVSFSTGDLVWAKLKGFDWWPGKVVSYLEARRSAPNPGSHWIKWFGDSKFSQVLHTVVRPFHEFNSKYNPSKMRGLYKKAVYEALEFAAKRSKRAFTKSDMTIKATKKKRVKNKKQRQQCEEPSTNLTSKNDDEPLTEEEYREVIVDWALGGFLPSGPLGFAPTEEEMNVRCSVIPSDSDEDDDADDESDGADKSKVRFGKPVNEPNLASDVKALFDEVLDGKRKLEEICLGCGDLKVCAKHPLFEGGLCKECKQTFLECSYLFDGDGYQMYCTICGDGKEVFMCDNEGCFRSYCGLCIDMLAGQGTVRSIMSQEKWICYMCSGKTKRLIKRRKDWQTRLHELFVSDRQAEYELPPVYPIIPPEDRKPIKVLALFDGIATGLQALLDLGIEVDTYYSAEIDEQAIQVAKVQHGDKIVHLGDVKNITEKQIREMGPFDLVVGGSPCQDLSIANPARRGIYEGTGRLFFEFFRLVMCGRPDGGSSRPFFWLFENVVGMRAVDKKTISRFLQSNPVVVDARDVSPAHRARYFWGNLPGMNRPTRPVAGDKLTLQECLEPNCGRKARFTKVQTITTNANSLRQTKKNLLPVVVSDREGMEREDILWCTEMERLFGFPSHYTDVNNMGRPQRQRLLGNAWSVPVIRHLLSPLKDYFKCQV